MSINEYYIYGTKKKLFDVNDVNFAVDFKKHLKQIIKNTSKKYNEILVLCIGTDRSTGDSFAPIIGTILSNNKKLPYKVLGTLENPIHAKNLVETLEKIDREKTLIIAVDACLDKIENVEKIAVFEGGLKPGSGVGKEHLPVVGDISIVGIVDCYGDMDFLILRNTRLGIVYKLAKITSKFLHETLCEISNVNILELSEEELGIIAGALYCADSVDVKCFVDKYKCPCSGFNFDEIAECKEKLSEEINKLIEGKKE